MAEPRRSSAAFYYAPTCAAESSGDDLRLLDKAAHVRRLVVSFPAGPEYALRLRPYAVGPDGSTRDLVHYPPTRPYLIGEDVTLEFEVDVYVPEDWYLGVYWENHALYDYTPWLLIELDWLSGEVA